MKVHIDEPYWGAGTGFGWDRALGLHGISIRHDIIKGVWDRGEILEVTIGKKPYEGKLYRVPLNLAKSLGKVNFAKGTELLCFPTSILEEVKDGEDKLPDSGGRSGVAEADTKQDSVGGAVRVEGPGGGSVRGQQSNAHQDKQRTFWD